ncbi:MAG: hypothetical protein ACFFB0_13335 [Promethearchaeota archaeon]
MRNFSGYLSDSERLHTIIKYYLLNNAKLIEKIKKKIETENVSRFFNYCLNCERKLDRTTRRNHHFHENIEIFELRFCCYCYERFKDKSFDEFPTTIIENIHKKIKAYKKYYSKE